MAEFYKVDDEVLEIAKDVMRYHPDLNGSRIVFVFRDKAQKLHGSIVLGAAQKVSEKYKVHFPYDFLITLALDQWQNMSDVGKKAVVDHELCHCTLTERGWGIRDHDIEEFREVVERHGLYKSDLMAFAMAVKEAPIRDMFRDGSIKVVIDTVDEFPEKAVA